MSSQDLARQNRWWPVILLTGVLFALDVWLLPVPAVNEPHYLTKARHFWQPDWCHGDLFLESADAHVAFFVLMGPLTTSLGFTAAAWIGRAVSLLLVAIGWLRLGQVLQFRLQTGLLAAAVFFLLQTIGNFSGEWLLGGVEGKVFTYGCLFWAAAEWIADRRLLAGGLAGAAITFHPVVGLWGLLAAAGSGTVLWLRNRPRPAVSEPFTGRNLQALLMLGITSLPGLLPVLQLLGEDASPQVKYVGNYLQVFYRLAHHLDPMRFSWRSYACYAALLIVWSLAVWRVSRNSPSDPAMTKEADVTRQHRAIRWLQGIVGWAILFALAGILIGWGPRPANLMPWFTLRMNLMKFYPFRLADILLPCALTWMVAVWWQRNSGRARYTAAITTILFLMIPAIHVWQQTGTSVAPDRQSDWIDVCRWIRDETPTDILVQTPHGRFTFKWYAQRPEYVCYKDCPQDATGIAEWNRRLSFLSKWYQQQFTDGRYSAGEMQQLSGETGITHLLTDRLGPIDLEPVYRNSTYRLYDLRTGR